VLGVLLLVVVSIEADRPGCLENDAEKKVGDNSLHLVAWGDSE
jgi:hypothetical protein